MRAVSQDHLSATFSALADSTRRAILARLSLGEISWHPNRRSPELAGKPMEFVPRKRFACAVNIHDKVHRLLPGDQVPVGLPHRMILREPSCQYPSGKDVTYEH